MLPRRDETGQVIILKDETGQPLVQRDETGQPLEPDEDDVTMATQADSLLSPRHGGEDELMLGGRPRDGGDEHRLRLTLVEGYNSNVFQTQAATGAPVAQHPSLFTGADVSADYHTWSRSHSAYSIRLNVRGQHYTPLDGSTVQDDGTANGAITGSWVLDARTDLRAALLGTVTSSNSALVTDGAISAVSPYNTVYTLEDAQLGLVHELSPRWRLNATVDEFIETSISSAPIVLSNGSLVYQRGLGSLLTLAELALRHDFDPYNVGGISIGGTTSFVPFVVDYTRVPPRYLGYATTESGNSQISWTHAFGTSWRSLLAAGVSVAESPPQDIPATGLVTTPTGSAALSFTRRYFIATASASYLYGSTTPILGYGPSTSAGFLAQGIPYPHGRWTQLAILASGSGTRSQLLGTGGTTSALDFIIGSVEARLSVNTWLGFVGGYNFRYSAGEGFADFPVLVRHVIFLGLGGYFADDKSLPTIETFAAPVVPSG